MNKYIQQLLEDIESIIVARWRKNPPHYFQAGLTQEPYLNPPQNWKIEDVDISMDNKSSLHTEMSIVEMEKWLNEAGDNSMFHHFGLIPEQFPPLEKLNEQQLTDLVLKICRLWASFNFTPVLPKNAPAQTLYPMLLERMLKNTQVMEFGNIGVEFCHYIPEKCPFGMEFCSCKEFLDD